MTASYHPPAAFPPQNSTERAALTAWIETTPLVYGPWQDFKKGFKTLESAYLNGTRDIETLGAILARVDAQPFPEQRKAATNTRRPLLPFGIYSLTAGDGVIYARTANGFQVFDAASPLVPTPISLPEGPAPVDAVLQGNRLLSSDGAVFDITNPRAPRLVARGNLTGQSFSFLGENHIIGFSHWEGLHVYRVPESGQAFTAVGSLEGGFNTCLVAGSRGVALYNSRQNYYRFRMRLLDLSRPEAPALGVEFGVDNERPQAISGSVLVTHNGQVLRTYDLTQDAPRLFGNNQPGQTPPRQLGSLDLPDLRSFQIHGQLGIAFIYRYDYRAGTTQNLVFIDLSQPHDPRKIGEIPADFVSSSALIGNILWLGTNSGLHVLDITNPARAQFIGQQPSAVTFGYLKRRGRRLLRALSETDSDAYVTLAAEILRRGAGTDVDFTFQWMEADILTGAGPVWKQARHGRGAVKRTAGYWRRRRLERAPQAWDSHLHLVRELAASERLPWQTRLTMRRILAANGQPVPAQSAAELEAVLWGDWPFAAVEAARAAEGRLGELTPRAIAALLWNVNPSRRRMALETLSPGGGPMPPAVGTHLAALLGRDMEWRQDTSQGSLSRHRSIQAGLTRRGREVALLLAARCDLSSRQFDGSGALPALPALLGSHEAPLRNLGLDLCRRLKPEQALELVALLPRIAPAGREAFIEALCVSAAGGRFNNPDDLAKRLRHSDAEVRAAVWRLLAASKTSATTVRTLWTGILRGLQFHYNYSTRVYTWGLSSFLETASNSPAALDLLARHGVNAREVMRFGPRFWGQPPAPAGIFAIYSLFVPAADLVGAIAAVPDAVWSTWKASWLRAVSNQPKILADFWSTVQSTLEAAKLSPKELDQLRARTFQAPDVAATFAGAAAGLPPTLLLQLIGAVSDGVWTLWRGALLTALQSDAATRTAFWNAARTVGLDSALLRTRLVGDAEIAATFGLLEGDALDFDDPALERLLLNWLEARRTNLGLDDLSRSAVHPLPEVRAWGLNHLAERGMNVPLALRLLESDLRDSIQAARHWFETRDAEFVASNQDNERIDLALALCDSPHLATRAYGREFLGQRLENLPLQELTARLQENPNAEMQSYVAELLLARQTALESANTTEFDRAVLRSRYRARKAKSLVQKRRAQSEPLPDERTLLELARGRTPRDADWALTQLAKRALETPVEGVEVSGVGAI